MKDDGDDLFGYKPDKRESRADQIFRRFAEFHKKNPRIWMLFKQYTFELIRYGFKHYGAGAVFERMRWHINIETRSEDGFKLSNDFRAYYARMFHAAYPDHGEFFRNRKLRSEDEPPFGVETSGFVNTDPPINEGRLMEQLKELLRQTER